MKKKYEIPELKEVGIKNAPMLLAGSSPEQEGTGDDGNDGEGLSRSYEW